MFNHTLPTHEYSCVKDLRKKMNVLFLYWQKKGKTNFSSFNTSYCVPNISPTLLRIEIQHGKKTDKSIRLCGYLNLLVKYATHKINMYIIWYIRIQNFL